MYQIANLDPKDLSKIKVNKQSRILELTGSKFDPPKGYEIIKNETLGFVQANEKAMHADALFADLLKVNGIVPEQKTETKKPAEKTTAKKEEPKTITNTVRIREQERARALKLLELELQISA